MRKALYKKLRKILNKKIGKIEESVYWLEARPKKKKDLKKLEDLRYELDMEQNEHPL